MVFREDLQRILGQERAVSFLQTVLQQDAPFHAYLFVGPPGVGKTKAAMAFACSLLADGGQAGAFNWTKDNHPDLFLAGKAGSKVGIAEVRRLEEWLFYRPYFSSYRVAILPYAHLLSVEAANALLKTLEEPPSYAVLILISDEMEVLPTIRSRCQEVRFEPIPTHLLEKALRERGIDPERARMAALLARGSLKRAYLFAELPDLEDFLGQGREFLLEVARGKKLVLLRQAQELERDEIRRSLFFGVLEVILRDVTVYSETKDEGLLVFRENADLAARLHFKPEQLRRVLEEFGNLSTLLRRNINPLLVNLNALLKLRQEIKEESRCR